MTDVGPAYFHAMLTAALDRYPALVSTGIANQDATLSGTSLVQRHLAGDRTYSWTGRNGGLHGAALTADITEQRWPAVDYQCSTTPFHNRNWFAIADFVAALRCHDPSHPIVGTQPPTRPD